MTNNGYVEITILGRKAGLKFNMYAIEQLETIKGRTGNIKNFTTIIFAGLLGNAYVKQVEPEFSFEEVSDWVDEQALSGDAEGELARVGAVFTQVWQRLTQNAKANGEPTEGTKKKLAKIKP